MIESDRNFLGIYTLHCCVGFRSEQVRFLEGLAHSQTIFPFASGGSRLSEKSQNKDPKENFDGFKEEF
jgi:hypothetical protein